MKDLKHLLYFERLLDDADNELIRKAQADGRKCVGSICYQTPEVLMDLDKTFPVRLRAPRSGSLEMSTYYLTSFLCEYSRAILERAMEGGYKFLDCMIVPDGCTMVNRCVENMELLHTIDKEGFFYRYLEVPMKADDNGLSLYVSECRTKILGALSENFGADVSDSALRDAVARHNKLCRLITEIGNFRKEDNPRITGYEFHIICMATYIAPKDMLIPLLEETLEELKTREPDPSPKYRARVVVAGSEIDDVDMIKLIEDSGALVVADRFCFGSLPGRQEIVLNDSEDVLTQICRQYLMDNQCPRHMNLEKVNGRKAYVANLVKEYKADGVIYEQMKFCDPWAYEHVTGAFDMREKYGYPVLTIDRPYAIGTSGQLRTRVQAFVESVEIKKLQGGKE
ncbi:MAG: 2-hydroxyacyl-CoA dehydratase [Clostridia bacterium]|nr:2-hydroxyacyl-CoA dehydratase [Clostridia bacterium]MBR5991692.1 2-hydroxyacyl-CoA dehydratase [Clostridia bacterium]MBR6479387.1 2-hydroxyacyl-CoA dehydratase [Clostridia bacterium]MBR6512509.1 2-hydroxyacyl-CoA dehydratase [Clostridia bacterium]